MRRLGPVARVDWFAVIVQINRAGVPTYRAAAEIGVPATTVRGWKNEGSEPNHHDGEKLLRLWAGLTGQSRESVPKTTEPCW